MSERLQKQVLVLKLIAKDFFDWKEMLNQFYLEFSVVKGLESFGAEEFKEDFAQLPCLLCLVDNLLSSDTSLVGHMTMDSEVFAKDVLN